MPVFKFSKPSGMPSDLWTAFHNQVLMPYVSKHASRLRGGMNRADISYLTSVLNQMTGGMSGLSEGEVYGPPSPAKPVQQTPWYQQLITSVASVAPKIAESITQYKLGKEAIKVGAPSAAAPPPPPILQYAEETPWTTYLLIGGVLLGGFFLARRYKFI